MCHRLLTQVSFSITLAPSILEQNVKSAYCAARLRLIKPIQAASRFCDINKKIFEIKSLPKVQS